MPLQLLPPTATLGRTLMPVVPQTSRDPFDRPTGLPLPLGTLAATLGHPSLELALAVSNDLGIEPKVRVEIVEVPKDPNTLVSPTRPTLHCLPRHGPWKRLHVADGVAAVLNDVTSSQQPTSSAREWSSPTPLLMLGDFRVVEEWPAPTLLLDHHGCRCHQSSPLGPTFLILTVLVVPSVWPLPPVAMTPLILATAPPTTPVCAPPDPATIWLPR